MDSGSEPTVMLRRHPVAGAIVLATGGLLGGMFAAVAIVPELQEGAGEDTILEAPTLTGGGRVVLLALALLAGAALVWELARAHRTGGTPSRGVEVTLVSIVFGVLAGAGVRVVTARTEGANIGGGLVVLVAPWAGLAFVAYLVARLRAIRRGPRSEALPVTLARGAVDVVVGSAAVDEWLELNRRRWDEMAELHASTYRVDEGGSAWEGLLPFERDELGRLDGERVCHLQCHIGGDTIALAELGAHAVGVDFSPKAIDIARRRAHDAGLGGQVQFVVSSVDEVRDLLDGTFDGVYTSWGVLCWLPDLGAWAERIAELLRPGGWLYLAETHPYAQAIGRPEEGYGGAKATFDDGQGDYTDRDAVFDNPGAWEWAHGLGEIVTALAACGLLIEWLHEHPLAPWHLNRSNELVQRADGLWEPPAGLPLPLSFSLHASKR